MWFGLGTDSSNNNYWVEVGFTDGAKYAGGCANTQPYWADNRSGGGYHEQYPSYSWNYGTWYQLWVEEGILVCSWTVNIGGTNLGTSTSNCTVDNVRTTQMGIEVTTKSANNWAKGSAWDWARKDSLDNWLSGWGATNFVHDDYPSIRFDPNYAYGTVTNEVHNVSF
jgi:hypothetical protein